MERVTILGGGVGGLALAAALRARGAETLVLEQAPAFGGAGAGVQISPNGAAVLDALGLGEVVAARSVASRFVVLRDGPTGREVIRLPQRGAFRMMRRDDLIDLLCRAAGPVRTGARAIGVAPGAITLAGGARLEAPRLVGADGVHSVVRPALNAAAAAAFTGQVAWRAIVRGEMPPEAHVFLGPGRHLVAYPVGGGHINLVGVEERAEWREASWRQTGDPDRFRATFAGFGPAARDLLERIESCGVWGLHLHPVARVWQREGMAILGDAAHPTLPFLAQGANLALEDAWCLAEALAARDTPAALTHYEASRRPRAERAIRAAAANARAYHLSGARRRAAHLALGLANRTAPGLMLRRYDWLYRHDVTA